MSWKRISGYRKPKSPRKGREKKPIDVSVRKKAHVPRFEEGYNLIVEMIENTEYAYRGMARQNKQLIHDCVIYRQEAEERIARGGLTPQDKQFFEGQIKAAQELWKRYTEEEKIRKEMNRMVKK